MGRLFPLLGALLFLAPSARAADYDRLVDDMRRTMEASKDRRAVPPLAPIRSPKKGLGMTGYFPHDGAEQLGLSWLYHWAPTNSDIVVPPGVEFVPMVYSYGSQDAGMTAIEALPAAPAHILGWNEPDGLKRRALKGTDPAKIQDGVDADGTFAVDKWADLAQRAAPGGARLVSPAPEYPGAPWLRNFMRGVDARGLQVDAVAIHFYPGSDPKAFIKTIEGACRTFATRGRKIWITEFAVADWPALQGVDGPRGKTYPKNAYDNRKGARQIADFMRVVLPYLEASDCVERYAWFHGNPNDPPGEDGKPIASAALYPSELWDKNGALTTLGAIYAYCSAPPGAPAPEFCKPE